MVPRDTLVILRAGSQHQSVSRPTITQATNDSINLEPTSSCPGGRSRTMTIKSQLLSARKRALATLTAIHTPQPPGACAFRSDRQLNFVVVCTAAIGIDADRSSGLAERSARSPAGGLFRLGGL